VHFSTISGNEGAPVMLELSVAAYGRGRVRHAVINADSDALDSRPGYAKRTFRGPAKTLEPSLVVNGSSVS
jgi:hypothetical protein